MPIIYSNGGGGIKWSAIVWGDAARIYTYLVMTAGNGTWRILADESGARRPDYEDVKARLTAPDYFECSRRYTDITMQTVDEYNEGLDEPERRRIVWRGE